MIRINKKCTRNKLEIDIPNDYVDKELAIDVQIIGGENQFSKEEILGFFKDGPTISSAEISEINDINKKSEQMEQKEVIIDFSIVVEYLRKTNKNKTQMLQVLDKFDRIYVSALTVFEIQAGLEEVNRKRVDNLLRFFTVLPFNKAVSDEAIKIYQQLKITNQGMAMRDLFIAATSRHYSIPLATLTMNNYVNVKNLTLINPDG